MGGLRPKKGVLGDVDGPVYRICSLFQNHHAAGFLILFLLVFHGVNNAIVMKSDNVLFTSQSANLYIGAATLMQEWKQSSVLDRLSLLRWHYASLYPIVHPGMSAIILSIIGFSQDNAVMSNLFWLAILYVAVYATAYL